MQNQKNPYYYLFSLSNFIAAFGGGMILGNGINVIRIPYLKNGSVLAFFIGSVLGLILLQLISKKLWNSVGRWFSLFGSLTSVALLIIFKKNEIDFSLSGTSGLIFFLLLSARFAFWFYSRVLRASYVAGKQQRIAWVELGYYFGMIIGLIIWKLIKLDISFGIMLSIDILLQFIAGIFDLFANHNSIVQKKSITSMIEIKPMLERVSEWRLVGSVVFLTIGIQVVIFSITSKMPEHFAPMIFAVYYFGVAMGAINYKKYNILIAWKKISTNAILVSEKMGIKKEASVQSILLITVLFSTFTILIFGHCTDRIFQYLFYASIFGAAFLYEIIALAILDRIGLEDSASKNMVTYSYGLMGIGAAISLWLLDLVNVTLPTLFFTLFLGACLAGYLVNDKLGKRRVLTE